MGKYQLSGLVILWLISTSSHIYGPEYLVNRILKMWDDVEISQRITNPESWYLPINYEELRINKSLEQNPYYDFQ